MSSGFPSLLVQSGLLGASCFGVSLLPLSFNFSRLTINRLSNFGTGLLLGAALGVILPEGVETMISSLSGSSGDKPPEVPTASIAVSLLTGFAFMLVVEQTVSHQHPHGEPSARGHSSRNDYNLGPLTPNSVLSNDPDLDFDLNLISGVASSTAETRTLVAFSTTLGLIVHALADGFALGAAALTTSQSERNAENSGGASLSVVVFLALLVHKAPAALALSTSLLATSLPRSQIQKHLAAFACSTPLGAVATYVLLELFAPASSTGGWTGFALLFSAGSFLYVATVLQPVSSHSTVRTDEPGRIARLVIVIVGMFVPHAIGIFIGHGHGHAEGPDLPGGVVLSER